MMIVSKPKLQTPWLFWGVSGLILVAIATTYCLTHSTLTPISGTPLAGLITLQTTAQEAVPYSHALTAEKPTLIEFYADWCTTCQSMASTIQSLHTQYSDHINFVMLNIDDPQWAPQVHEYGASGVPQFTLLDSGHHEVSTLVGKVPKPIFYDLFKKVLTIT